MPDATLQDQVQDAPVWFVCVLFLLSALAGEMYRVDKQHRLSRQLFVRIAVRAFASSMIGMIAFAWCQHRGLDIWATGAITGSLAMLGADFVIALGTVLIKRKFQVR